MRAVTEDTRIRGLLTHRKERLVTAKHFPPVQYLHECFFYDPDTGLFVWRERPSDHFLEKKRRSSWNTRWAGTPAMTQRARNGYLLGRVSCEGVYFKMLAHRVAWAMMTGEHPQEQVSHIDRNRTNNRWANLRDASQSQNNWYQVDKNRPLPRGVNKNGKNGFSAGIWNHGKYTYLGTFRTPEEAGKAWRDAANATRGEFAGAA